MKQFFFPISLSEQDLERLISRYHFDGTDLTCVYQVYQQIRLSSEIAVGYEILREDVFGTKEAGPYALGMITLGRELDDLQDAFSSREELGNAYLAEAIGMEALMGAYRIFNRKLAAQEKLWVKRYCFFGQQLPLEQMKKAFEIMPQDQITCNESYMMKPAKSVVFLALLSEKETNCEGICSGCRNLLCQNRVPYDRPQHYGYQRIFAAYASDGEPPVQGSDAEGIDAG